jgi:hypothetical protein
MNDYLRLAVVLSVQILFWTMFVRLSWSVGRLLQVAKREERVSKFIVSFLTTAAHRYGEDPTTVQDELTRCVEAFHQASPVTTRSFLQRLWRRR